MSKMPYVPSHYALPYLPVLVLHCSAPQRQKTGTIHPVEMELRAEFDFLTFILPSKILRHRSESLNLYITSRHTFCLLLFGQRHSIPAWCTSIWEPDPITIKSWFCGYCALNTNKEGFKLPALPEKTRAVFYTVMNQWKSTAVGKIRSKFNKDGMLLKMLKGETDL